MPASIVPCQHDSWQSGLSGQRQKRTDESGSSGGETAVGRWQANGSLRDDIPPVDVIALLEPLAMLAVTTDEYDETYCKQRDLSIEMLACGLEPYESAGIGQIITG